MPSIWFHTIVLDLFRPFGDLNPQPKFTTFMNDNATPAKVIEASIHQLKRLIYTYRSTSQSSNFSVIWQSGMLYLVNHISRDYSDKEAHFYFLLCMRGYQNLAHAVPLARGVLEGFAAMAVQLNTILPNDALKLFEEVRSENECIQNYAMTYPVRLDQSTMGSDAATLDHLVDDFRKLRDLDWEHTGTSTGRNDDVLTLFTTLRNEKNDTEI